MADLISNSLLNCLSVLISNAEGGDFDYLGRAYGPQAAFSFAWFNFFISKTGSQVNISKQSLNDIVQIPSTFCEFNNGTISSLQFNSIHCATQAIIATVFGRYFEAVYLGINLLPEEGALSIHGETFVAKCAAASCIIFFTLLNCAGVRESVMLQRVLTSLKLLLVVFLFIVAMVFVSSNSSVFQSNLSVSKSFNGSKGMTSFFSAMIACLWSFDGWADLNFLMEEIINPEKTLPRVVLCSLGTVTAAYLLANIAYFSVLDTSVITTSKSIGKTNKCSTCACSDCVDAEHYRIQCSAHRTTI